MFSLSSLGYIFGYLSGCVSTYLWIHYNNLYNKFQNDIVSLGYNTIKLYTDIKESALGKKALYYSQLWYDATTFYFYDRHREPSEPFWTYSCSLHKSEYNYYVLLTTQYKFELVEQYNEFANILEVENKNVKELLSSFLNYKSCVLNDERLGILKYENNYIIRYFCGIESLKKMTEKLQLELSENKTTIPRSKFGVLSVEYVHPQMKKPVSLDITKNMCMVGNHLFSPEFVFKCLKYQNEPYLFNLHYKIRIMDNNLNEFELTSQQYIELNEKSYIIHTRY
jgi:hypothetical protein